MMKKFIEMTRNSKNSLTELLVYLYDCVSRKNKDFLKEVNESYSKTRKENKLITSKCIQFDDKLTVESFLTEKTI